MQDRETRQTTDPLIVPYGNFSPEVFASVLPQWEISRINYRIYNEGKLVSISQFGWDFKFYDGSEAWKLSVYEERDRRAFISPAELRLTRTMVPQIDKFGWKIDEVRINETEGKVELMGPKGFYKIEKNGRVHTIVPWDDDPYSVVIQ